jgi:hypothetical protein
MEGRTRRRRVRNEAKQSRPLPSGNSFVPSQAPRLSQARISAVKAVA